MPWPLGLHISLVSQGMQLIETTKMEGSPNAKGEILKQASILMIKKFLQDSKKEKFAQYPFV
tara:strand:+ start:232 stop:417 length:186 start_codon:yes stop_codon:yes gene_type:complete